MSIPEKRSILKEVRKTDLRDINFKPNSEYYLKEIVILKDAWDYVAVGKIIKVCPKTYLVQFKNYQNYHKRQDLLPYSKEDIEKYLEWKREKLIFKKGIFREVQPKKTLR